MISIGCAICHFSRREWQKATFDGKRRVCRCRLFATFSSTSGKCAKSAESLGFFGETGQADSGSLPAFATLGGKEKIQ